jgi:hypothetical protein
VDTTVEEIRKDSMVRSHLFLRRTMGVLGIVLPFTLLFVGKMFGTVPQASVSDYFHTNMQRAFVGVIVTFGLFLIAYTGYHRHDNLLGNFAGFCALGIIIFPTTPVDPSPIRETVGILHFVSAGLFFVSLIVFCVHFFRKGKGTPGPQKLRRNQIYLLTGILMGLSIILIVTHKWLGFPAHENSVFWLEAVALVAFGIAWLIKGKFMLADEGDEEAVFGTGT